MQDVLGGWVEPSLSFKEGLESSRKRFSLGGEAGGGGGGGPDGGGGGGGGGAGGGGG